MSSSEVKSSSNPANNTTTFLEALLECTNFIESARKNPGMDKEEMCKSLESRLSRMVTKAVAAPLMGGGWSGAASGGSCGGGGGTAGFAVFEKA